VNIYGILKFLFLSDNFFADNFVPRFPLHIRVLFVCLFNENVE